MQCTCDRKNLNHKNKFFSTTKNRLDHKYIKFIYLKVVKFYSTLT
jgi:hypothetical protein